MESDQIKATISHNIGKYRELSGMNQKEFARRLGVSPSRVSNWEQGANCPTIDILFEVCDVLNVSINDIYGIYPDAKIQLSYEEIEHIRRYRMLDGHGKKVVNYILESETERTRQIKELHESTAYYNVRRLPFIGMNAAAGTFTEFMDAADDTVECQDSDICRKADFAIGVTGDSMEPTYSSGDIVLVRYSSEIPIGKIGLFRRGSEIFIKERGKDGLISHNPERPFQMDVNNIECIGEVLGKAAIARKEE